MNNINTNQITDPNVQQPFLGPSLAFLQDATIEALGNTIQGLIGSTYDPTKVYILWGCVLTGVSTGSGAYSVTAGAVFFNGEIYTVDAVSGTLASQTLYSAEVTTNPSPDPVEFSDGSTKNVHDVRKWVITAGSSGSNAFSTWLPFDKGNDWVDATLDTGITNVGSPFANAGYYKSIGGIVRLRGALTVASGGTPSTPRLLFTLPAGYRPSHEYRFAIYYSQASGTISAFGDNGFMSVSVNTLGEVYLVSQIGTVSQNIEISGVSFRVAV